MAPRKPLVSITFSARAADGSMITFDIEDPAHLNMSNANARAFLSLLRLNPGAGPDGEVPLAAARRAVMRGRATFQRRASRFTRLPTDTTRPDQPRVVEFGIDEDYLARRLEDFERFLLTVAERGAVSISWG